VIDGSNMCERRIKEMLFWDVNNGIARRAWARNAGAVYAIKQAMASDSNLKVTLPEPVEHSVIAKSFK
jgi:urocanate hydratase